MIESETLQSNAHFQPLLSNFDSQHHYSSTLGEGYNPLYVQFRVKLLFSDTTGQRCSILLNSIDIELFSGIDIEIDIDKGTFQILILVLILIRRLPKY